MLRQPYDYSLETAAWEKVMDNATVEKVSGKRTERDEKNLDRAV